MGKRYNSGKEWVKGNETKHSYQMRLNQVLVRSRCRLTRFLREVRPKTTKKQNRGRGLGGKVGEGKKS